jgi:hypothetical protein
VLMVKITVDYKVLERPNCNRPAIRNSVPNEKKEITSEFHLNLTLRSHFEVAASALTSVHFALHWSLCMLTRLHRLQCQCMSHAQDFL